MSRSSTEAEFRSMASTVAEVVCITELFKELRTKLVQPIQLHCDSKVAIQIAAHPIFHERTKHIDIDCHFVREKLVQGPIKTQYVRTTEQLADLLTKSLCKQQHEYLLNKLGMKMYFIP